MGLTFVPLGVGDAFTALHYSSSLAVEAEGALLLLDCPHPIQKMLREASQRSGRPLTPDRISAVALTHLHADHSSGLEGLGYFFYFSLKKRLRILAHPTVSSRLWERLGAGMECLQAGEGEPVRMRLEDYFELVPLREDAPTREGPFELECRRTIHPVPTTAFRLRAAGRCLGVSADTAFDPGLVEWLSAADLFVHETGPGVHTSYEKLLSLPEPIRRKIRLGHYPDSFEAEKSQIPPLEEGRIYRV